MSAKAAALGGQAPAAGASGRGSRAGGLLAGGDMHGRGEAVVGDCPILTWSLGWTGGLPPRLPASSSLARPAITSLAFMLDWVPGAGLPDHQGEVSSSLPATTSAAVGGWCRRASYRATRASCWFSGRRLLHQAEGPGWAHRHALAADAEVLPGSAGSGRPVAIRRHGRSRPGVALERVAVGWSFIARCSRAKDRRCSTGKRRGGRGTVLRAWLFDLSDAPHVQREWRPAGGVDPHRLTQGTPFAESTDERYASGRHLRLPLGKRSMDPYPGRDCRPVARMTRSREIPEPSGKTERTFLARRSRLREGGSTPCPADGQRQLPRQELRHPRGRVKYENSKFKAVVFFCVASALCIWERIITLTAHIAGDFSVNDTRCQKTSGRYRICRQEHNRNIRYRQSSRNTSAFRLCGFSYGSTQRGQKRGAMAPAPLGFVGLAVIKKQESMVPASADVVGPTSSSQQPLSP